MNCRNEDYFREVADRHLAVCRWAFLHLQVAYQKGTEIFIMTYHSPVTISNVFFSFWKAKVYMIAAGVIAGVYLLGITVLFLGVKERDGKLYLSMPQFNNSYFTLLYLKDFYFMYSASLRSLCLKFRQSNSFLQGAGAHHEAWSICEAYSFISSHLNSSSGNFRPSQSVCWPHSTPSMGESEMQITFGWWLEGWSRGCCLPL